MKRIIITWLLLIVASLLLAIHDDAGTRGFAFMKVNYSARAMGLGNAFTAVTDDPDVVFFNPAGLAKTTPNSLRTNYMNYIDGLQGGSISFIRSLENGWMIAPFTQFMFSGGIARTTVDHSGEYTGTFGTFSTANIIAGMGFARTLHDVLDLGFNLKYIYERLDSYSATAVALDLGLIHQTNNENLVIGVSLRNIGHQLSYFIDNDYPIGEQFPLKLTVGAALSFSRGVLNVDVVRPIDNDFYGRIGFEFYTNPHLTIRTGVDTRMNDYRGNDTFSFASGISLGFGLTFSDYFIDYAVSSMGGLGFVNQLSVGRRF
jgi:hypothetical protein